MSKEITIPFTKICVGRFFFLLIALFFLLVFYPFIEGLIGIRLLIDIFVTLILLSAIYAVSYKRQTFYIALFIAFPTLIAHWYSYLVTVPYSLLAAKIFTAIFFAFMVVIILNYLFQEKKITADIIAGAICAYFLIGMMWASFFAILEIV